MRSCGARKPGTIAPGDDAASESVVVAMAVYTLGGIQPNMALTRLDLQP